MATREDLALNRVDQVRETIEGPGGGRDRVPRRDAPLVAIVVLLGDLVVEAARQNDLLELLYEEGR